MRQVVFALLLVSSVAHASHQMVMGKLFILRSSTDGSNRRGLVRAKERASPDTIVGDPTTAGATLTIAVDGATPGTATFALPQGTSTFTTKPFWSGDATKSFRYSDLAGETGPIKLVRLKATKSAFQVKVVFDERGGPVPVAPPNPGTSSCVTLAIGNGDSYDVKFVDGAFENGGNALFKISKPLTEGLCDTTTATLTTTTATSTSTTRTTTTSTSTTKTTTTSSTTSTTRTTTTSTSTSTTKTTTTTLAPTTSTTKTTTTTTTKTTTTATVTTSTTTTTKTTTTTTTKTTTTATVTTSTTTTTKTTTTTTATTATTATTTTTTKTTTTTTATVTTSTTTTTKTTTTTTATTTTTTKTTTTATTTSPTTTTTLGETPNVVTFGSAASDDAAAVAVDAVGNEIVCGTVRGTMTVQGKTISPNGPSDAYLGKVSPNGTLLWLHNYGGAGDDYCLAVTVDPAGDIVAGGQYTGTGGVGGAPLANHGGVDVWIAKFSGVNGAHVWSAGYGGASTDAVNAIRTDAGGNVWATGFFQDTINFGGTTLTSGGVGDLDCFLLKLGAAGGHLYSTNFPGGTGQCQGKGLAVDGSGNVHLVGFFTNSQSFGGGPLASPNTKYDAFVAKFSSSGAHTWSLRLGNANGDDSADAVAVDGSGNVYVAGYVTGDVDFGNGVNSTFGGQDGYVLKLSSAGAFRAVQRIGEIGNDYASAVAVDTGGNVLVGGSFEGTAAFGGTTSLVANARDGFLAKYTSALAPTSWKAKCFGGSGGEWTKGVATSPAGFDIGVGYSSSAMMNLDGVSMPSAGTQDGWASRVAP